MTLVEETEASIPYRTVPSLKRNDTTDGNTVSDSVNLKQETSDDTKDEVEEVTDGKVSESQSPVLQKTRKEQVVSNVQFGALCWSLFILGWNDGTTGPLLPRMREVYNVGFTVVSLVFVLACAGFIIGALLNVWLTDRLGFGKVMVLGAALQIVAFSVQAPAPPFAAFVALNLVNGVGLALQDAQANGFVGALKEHAETKMGFLHAAYGLGAFSSPLVATQFAQMERWSFHYLVSLGLAVSNTALLAVIFRFNDQTACLIEGGERVGAVTEANDSGKFRQIMTNKTVHFLAFFILVYVGVEVTLGGWIVTYIIDVRGGGPSAGYVSSGFFGGLTLGRVVLLPVNKFVGERRVLFIYAILAFGLEFVIWFVPSLVGNAIAVSIIGMLLGPMYPIAMNHASRVFPPWILTGSIGWIAGFGQAGSAVIPFMTGAIAQKHGIQSLHPLLVAMMVLMTILFWLTPSEPLHEASLAEVEGEKAKEASSP